METVGRRLAQLIERASYVLRFYRLQRKRVQLPALVPLLYVTPSLPVSCHPLQLYYQQKPQKGQKNTKK